MIQRLQIGRGVLACGMALAMLAGLAHAQDPDEPGEHPQEVADTTATLAGTVASSVDGRGVSGARILIPALSRGTISEDDGTFQITDLPPGEHEVRVEYFDVATNTRRLELRAGHITRATFLLENDVLQVAELVVEVKRPRQPADWMAEFRRRRAMGFGYFLDRDDIAEKRVRLTSDLFRQIPGLFVTHAGFEGARLIQQRGPRQCQPALFVDGILTGRYPIDDLDPDDIEGIEFYQRGSQVPFQFQRGNCGSVVVWTRLGGDSG